MQSIADLVSEIIINLCDNTDFEDTWFDLEIDEQETIQKEIEDLIYDFCEEHSIEE